MSARSVPHRILILTPQLPYPPNQGTKIRNYNLIANLSRRRHIDILSFAEDTATSEGIAHLHGLCARVWTVPIPVRSAFDRMLSLVTTLVPDLCLRLRSDRFTSRLDRVLASQQYDVIQAEGLEMSRYVLQARERIRPLHHRPLLVLDDHNAEYVLQRRAFQTDLRRVSRWPFAAYSLIQWRRLKQYEARLCRSVDRVIAVSSADAHALCELAPGLSVTVVPNGVDPTAYDPVGQRIPQIGSNALVFTGKMDFRPNVDGVVWFCNHILPLVRAEIPDVRLYIVGKSPAGSVRRLSSLPGVVVTGYVRDILPYFRSAAVYVVPLRVGGGTRLKVLEAMAMQCPIVSTSLGAEGIGISPGKEIVLADDPASFAGAVAGLLRSESDRRSLGLAARSFVKRHFDWRDIVDRLDPMYSDASATMSPNADPS